MATLRHKTVRVRVGVDIGQQADHTAIVVTEEQRRQAGPQALDYYVTRMIERMPLGTPYPAVADRIVAIAEGLQRRSAFEDEIGAPAFPVDVVIDATGVGLPVLDLVQERGIQAQGAIFTGSDKRTPTRRGVVSIGKGWLVSRLQVLLQAGRLLLPQTDEANVLTRELQSYDASINPRGHASFNARSGQHDDLVIALGLSVGEGGTSRGGTAPWLPSADEDIRDWYGQERAG